MSLSDFPSLPKSTHSRKRSASDPACLTSTTGLDSNKEVTSFEKTLAALNAVEKAKARADIPRAARKDRGIGITNGVASGDGVVDQQSEVRSDSAYKNSARRPFTKAVTDKGAVNGSAQKTVSSLKPIQSTVNAGKDISRLSPMELKALSDSSVTHVKLATIDPTLPSSQQTPKIIHESYPLPLLRAISQRIASVLASRTMPDSSRKASTVSATSDSSNTGSTSGSVTVGAPEGLVLHTTSPTPLTLILAYALSSSLHGSLIHPIPYSLLKISLSDCAFFKYGKIVEEARYLGFTFLETTLLKRMRKIAAGQVHSADVERILGSPVSTTMMGESNWMLEIAVTSIATAFWEDRLQYKHKYDELCEKYPAFDLEVCEAIEALDETYGYD